MPSYMALNAYTQEVDKSKKTIEEVVVHENIAVEFPSYMGTRINILV